MMMMLMEKYLQREMNTSTEELSQVLLVIQVLFTRLIIQRTIIKCINVLIIQKDFCHYKQHDDLNRMLWNVFPCTFCCAHNHCVAKCQKRKALVNKMNMLIGSETKKENLLPSSKTFFRRNAHKIFCNHCNISGH